MKYGFHLETIEHEGRTHLAIHLDPPIEELLEAVKNEDPGAVWIHTFIKALQEYSSGIHYNTQKNPPLQ